MNRRKAVILGSSVAGMLLAAATAVGVVMWLKKRKQDEDNAPKDIPCTGSIKAIKLSDTVAWPADVTVDAKLRKVTVQVKAGATITFDSSLMDPNLTNAWINYAIPECVTPKSQVEVDIKDSVEVEALTKNPTYHAYLRVYPVDAGSQASLKITYSPDPANFYGFPATPGSTFKFTKDVTFGWYF